jgi:hypothetical protein
MICERYWREGIVLVERGLDDPHRDGCEDCARAHASRQELIDALPLIGMGVTDDPHWQTRVWQVIDGKPAGAPWRWRWQLGGALAAAAVLALWIGLDRAGPGDVRPHVAIIETGPPRRSEGGAAHVDDLLQVFAGEASDVWIYREDHLELRCQAHAASDRCRPDPHGMTVEMVLSTPGEYRVIVTMAPFALPPRGKLDDDLAALESASAAYKDEHLSVR